MGRPRKVKVTNQKTGESAESVLRTDDIQDSASTFEEQEAREEGEALDLDAFRKSQHLRQSHDELTNWLKKKFSLAYLEPEHNYMDSRFPKMDRKTMKVKRFYASLNLCVDEVPASWTEEMILAKKWAIEKLGMSYIGTTAGEKGTEIGIDELEARLVRLTEEPKYRFEEEKFKVRFTGASNLRVN